MKLSLTLLSILSTYANAGSVVSLTPDNYQSETAGKAVFIKFFAPWCVHCKSMAPAYEKLATSMKSTTSKLIAEVDCTNEKSKQLCTDNDVKGFPTLKYGNPAALEDYVGGRDYTSLLNFVESELKVSCSPFNIELCSEEEQKEVESIMKMSDEEIASEIAKVDLIIAKADKDLEEGIEGLQAKFEDMMNAHEDRMDEMMEESNHKLMKSVLMMKRKELGEDYIPDDDDDDDDFEDDEDYVPDDDDEEDDDYDDDDDE